VRRPTAEGPFRRAPELEKARWVSGGKRTHFLTGWPRICYICRKCCNPRDAARVARKAGHGPREGDLGSPAQVLPGGRGEGHRLGLRASRQEGPRSACGLPLEDRGEGLGGPQSPVRRRGPLCKDHPRCDPQETEAQRQGAETQPETG